MQQPRISGDVRHCIFCQRRGDGLYRGWIGLSDDDHDDGKAGDIYQAFQHIRPVFRGHPAGRLGAIFPLAHGTLEMVAHRHGDDTLLRLQVGARPFDYWPVHRYYGPVFSICPAPAAIGGQIAGNA